MATRYYSFVLRNCDNTVEDTLINLLTVDLTLALNKPGALTIVAPAENCTVSGKTYRISDLDQDMFIEVWCRREPNGVSSLVGETVWFINRLSERQDEQGRRTLEITAASAMELLARRIIAYTENRGVAEFNADDTLDNLAKFAVRRNFITDNTTIVEPPNFAPTPVQSYTRFPPAAGFPNGVEDPIRNADAIMTVAANLGAIADMSYAAQIHSQPVLQVLQRLANYSTGRNLPLFFDIVKSQAEGAPYLEFRTYADQRGTDRRVGNGVNPEVVISNTNTTIANYELTFDWSNSVNRVYAGRSSDDENEFFAYAEAPNLAADVAACPAILRETFVNVNSDDNADKQSAADAELEANAASTQVSGNLLSRASFEYGVDWDFGDRLTASISGVTIDVWVDKLSIQLRDGEETLTAGFSSNLNTSVQGFAELVQAIDRNREQLNYLNANSLLV